MYPSYRPEIRDWKPSLGTFQESQDFGNRDPRKREREKSRWWVKTYGPVLVYFGLQLSPRVLNPSQSQFSMVEKTSHKPFKYPQAIGQPGEISSIFQPRT
jgi:hypothetical protein